MKIKVIKTHSHYSIGVHEVTDERGEYLKRINVAESVGDNEEVTGTTKKPPKPAEKKERKHRKEKSENIKHTPKNEH